MTPRAQRLVRWLGEVFEPFSIGIADLKSGQDALNQKVSEMATKADVDAALATLKTNVETALGDLKTAIANNAASSAATVAADNDAIVSQIGVIQNEITAVIAAPGVVSGAPAA